jgi:predicted kinase
MRILEKIKLAALNEGVNDPGIFKAVFLAGGPGSGKSFIVGKTALTTMGLKLINSDDAFEHQLAKVGLTTSPEDIYSDLGQSVRGKAKALTAKRQSIALQGRLGLVIDGTGKDYDKIKKQADQLRKIGYEVAMVFVNTDLDTAQARNKARTRTLPEKEVTDMWNSVQKNIGKFQNYFGANFIVVDNSEGANYEGAVNSAYKKMAKWIKTEPKSSLAKKWIKAQKAERGMKEELDLNEEFENILNEKTLTPAELKKREIVAKAIERENPDMPMDKKMAIATAQAKKVAEETEEVEENWATKAMAGKSPLKKKYQAPKDGEPDRAKRMKKKMYGSMMGGLKKEEVELDEAKLDASDFEAMDPPKGIDYDDKNLRKVNWKLYDDGAIRDIIKRANSSANERSPHGPDYQAAGKGYYQKIIKAAKAELKKRGIKEEVELDEAYKTPEEAKAFEAGKKAARDGKKYGDNPNTDAKLKLAWSKGHNKARARKMGIRESIAEAVATGKQKAALKALMRQALGGKAPNAGYTSSIATNGDFVVYDGGMRIQGRIKKGDFTDPMKG